MGEDDWFERLEDDLGFERRDVEFAGGNSVVDFAVDVFAGVVERDRQSVDPVAIDVDVNVAIIGRRATASTSSGVIVRVPPSVESVSDTASASYSAGRSACVFSNNPMASSFPTCSYAVPCGTPSAATNSGVVVGPACRT